MGNLRIDRNVKLAGKNGLPVLVDVFAIENGTVKPVLVFAHGFKGFKDWGHYNLVAETFAKAGFVFVKLNFSHNGTSEESPSDFVNLEAFGQNNFTKELNDLDVVLDWICTEKASLSAGEIDVDSINLIGHSRGGGVCVIKASEDKRVKRLVTWASVASLDRYWKDEALQKRWKEEGVIKIMNGRTKQEMPMYWQLCEDCIDHAERLNVIEAAKRLEIPFLVVHGTSDPAVRFINAELLVESAASARLLQIDGGDHVFGGKHPWVEDKLPKDAAFVVNETAAFCINA